MYRATTPKQIFSFDVNPDETFKEILITYAQGGKTILEKHKEDLTFDEESTETDCGEWWSCWFRMTQEESNLFSAEARAQCKIQVRVLTYADEVVAFPIESRPVQSVLNDEVLE